MLTVIFVASVRAGQEANFEDAVARLAADIAQEPGCAGMTWGPTETAGEYALIERYIDRQALETHRASPHMKKQGPAIFSMLDGTPTITRIEEKRPL